MKSPGSVDEFIDKHTKWKGCLKILRTIILTCDLKESIKWNMPVYAWENKNVLGMGAFKNHVGLWFFQGALLADKAGKLHNAQDGKTKAMRQWHFNSSEQIEKDRKIIIAYVMEAIANEKAGNRIAPLRTKEIVVPEELADAMTADDALRAGFESLSFAKKRDYAEYILEAKKEETRIRRLERIIPMITSNMGLNDKYK